MDQFPLDYVTFLYYIIVIICSILIVSIIILVKLFHNLKGKNTEILRLTKENSKLEAIADNFENYKRDIEKINENSKLAFTTAAKDLYYSTSQDLVQKNRTSVEDLMKPIKEQIDALRNQIITTTKENSNNRTSIETNIKNLLEQTQKISNDASNLTKALRGDKKLQGDWGESILETLLKSSGLQEGVQYFSQKDYTDISSNRHYRPDIVIRLPQDDTYLIVDSKVSLNSYVDYCNSEDETIKQSHLSRHVEALKSHIDELSHKDYITKIHGAIDFVLMFIPNEASYIVALQAEPSLQQYAQKKKVIMVSPTNLIISLQLTLLLWKAELQKQNIDQIINLGNQIYDKFVTFANGYANIGAKLDQARKEYDDSMARLVSGRDSLLNKMKRFKDMGLTPSKRINDKFEQYTDEIVVPQDED